MSETVASLPAPRQLPLLGSALRLRPDLPDFQLELLRECGDIGRIKLGPMNVVVVTEPRLVREVLCSDHFWLSHKSEVVRPLIGDFLYFQPPLEHAAHRRLVADLFSPRLLIERRADVYDLATEAMGGWPTEDPVDLGALWLNLLLRIGSRTFLGPGADQFAGELMGPLHIFLEHCAKLFNGVALPLGWPTPHNHQVRRALRQMNGVAEELVRQHREHRAEQPTLISVLADAQQAGAKISDRNIHQSVSGIFLASTHTSESALTWATLSLIENRAAYDELREAGRSDIDHPYAEQVVRESMRLRPPLAALPREATADTTLGGVTIKTGTQVYALLRAMQRRQDVYPDPHEFRPERFGESGSADRTLPFGMGCHYCVGSPFAMMQNRLLIALLLQVFDVERFDDGPLGENRFFLQPPPRTRFVLHRR